MDVIGEVGRLFQHFSFPVSRPAAGELGHAAIEARFCSGSASPRVRAGRFLLGSASAIVKRKCGGELWERRSAAGPFGRWRSASPSGQPVRRQLFARSGAWTDRRRPGRLRRRRDSDLRRQAVQRPGKCKHRKAAAGAYCNCFANGMADRISDNRLRELSGLSDAQKIAEMKPLIDASDRLCLQELEHSLPTAK
jgi:hypothetical protein